MRVPMLFALHFSCLTNQPRNWPKANNSEKKEEKNLKEIIKGDYDVLSKSIQSTIAEIFPSYAEKLGPVVEKMAIKLNKYWAMNNSASADITKSHWDSHKKQEQITIQQNKDDCKNRKQMIENIWETYAPFILLEYVLKRVTRTSYTNVEHRIDRGYLDKVRRNTKKMFSVWIQIPNN